MQTILRGPCNVLIAPLDWGLGHATRCISIIRCLLEKGCHVYVACEGSQKKLLNQEFAKTSITFLTLRGYRVQYSTNKRWLPIKIIFQLPKILYSITYENKWLKAAVLQYNLQLVISDNRYGMHHQKVPCIFITHQLQIQAPVVFLKKWMQRISYRYINRFNECWVPDFKEGYTLAGALSHPSMMPQIQVKYIGPLGRFENIASEKKYDWLIILSGPEPQRTILEKKFLEAVSYFKKNIVFLRALPGTADPLPSLPNCTLLNHTDTITFSKLIAQSEYIISRPGYTTVMEILALQKKFICIPTPGQTEQEYLGAHLMQQQWCYTFKQSDNFIQQLQIAEGFHFKHPSYTPNLFKPFLDAWL